MTRPVALASYQWPPSNEVIAEKVGLDPRDIIRFDGNVAATPPPSARPAALAAPSPTSTNTTVVDITRCERRSPHVTAWALIRSRSGRQR